MCQQIMKLNVFLRSYVNLKIGKKAVNFGLNDKVKFKVQSAEMSQMSLLSQMSQK